jgi:hypothetical protein
LNDFKLEVDIILDFSAHRNAPNKCLTFWGHIKCCGASSFIPLSRGSHPNCSSSNLFGFKIQLKAKNLPS